MSAFLHRLIWPSVGLLLSSCMTTQKDSLAVASCCSPLPLSILGDMKPLNDCLVWPAPFRLIVRACALVPLFFAVAWSWTFGFTPYRNHLAFIGLPLGLCCICLAVGMLRMQRWAILLSIPLSAFVGLLAGWIAVISCHWFYWLLFLAGVSYALLISTSMTARKPHTSKDNSRND